MSGVFLSVSRDGWTNGLQLSVEDNSGGFRLAGPKFNGSGEYVLRRELDSRDCDELEHYIAKARASLAKARGEQP